jgi:hypothetical protein
MPRALLPPINCTIGPQVFGIKPLPASAALLQTCLAVDERNHSLAMYAMDKLAVKFESTNAQSPCVLFICTGLDQ